MTLKTNFKLLRDLVMIYPIKAKSNSGNGLIVISADPTAPLEGMVLAAGPEASDYAYGDRIMFMKTDAREVKYEKDTFIVVKSEEILCKLEAE